MQALIHRLPVVAAAILTIHVVAGCASPAGNRWNFDQAGTGTIPAGWQIAETNSKGSQAKWSVVADASAPSAPSVFALTASANTGQTFNLALAKDTSFGDLELEVLVKANEGAEDQGGGPVWRCTDENNYYICRFNPLEQNFRVYKVVDSKRTMLASADAEMVAGQWYPVSVRHIGKQIICTFNWRVSLVARDDTFSAPGMVGLWTKADAVTSFDDLAVREVPAN